MAAQNELREMFSKPPVSAAPGYFWFLNGKLDETEIRRTLQDFAAKGAKMIYPHPFPVNFRDYTGSKMEPDYLTEEYFKFYGIILEECKKLGLEVGLYDEGGWPSGGACGRVWASDPEKFSCQYLVADGPGKVRIEYAKTTPAKAAYPNLLQPDAVKKFIELTHEQYYKRFGSYFGTVIKFAFTDEPGFLSTTGARLTWCSDFAEEFKKRKKYDITPFLADILAGSVDPAVVQAKIDYHDVKAQLFTERYTIPLQKWCQEHGIKSAGHLSGEDELSRMMYYTFGHIMRTLRTLDIPGVDLIWRQIWQDERLHTFPKFASSAARQIGSNLVSGELFGVYGAGLTPEQMKFITAYTLLCGVNTFVSCDVPYYSGNMQMQGERPFFGKLNPMWKYLDTYHLWTNRIAALSINSAPIVENALFIDTVSLHTHDRIAAYSSTRQEQIARKMLENKLDFDYADEDILLTATFENNMIKAGHALYKRLIIPAGARMSDKVSGHLKKLKADGAEIISSDEIYKLRPLLDIEGNNTNFMLRTHCRSNGSRIYFILNTSTMPQMFSCKLPAAPSVIADPEDGKFYRTAIENNSWKRNFAPGELVIIISGADAIPNAEPQPIPGEAVANIDGNWNIKKLRQHSVGKDDYIIEECADSRMIPAATGDWSKFLGQDFSGEAEYTVDFDSTEKDCFIDLGEVKYVASVSLNGIELGTRIAPPYIFDASKAMRPGTNKLRVRVTNTLANAIASPAVWQRWKKELPRVYPYELISRFFEQESLPSGLYGPVQLKKRR